MTLRGTIFLINLRASAAINPSVAAKAAATTTTRCIRVRIVRIQSLMDHFIQTRPLRRRN